jgi:hypothetical protein
MSIFSRTPKKRTIAAILNSAFWSLWIFVAFVDGISFARTATGSAAIRMRALLTASAVSVLAFLTLLYLFRGILFTQKPSAEMTSKESVQLTIFFVVTIACLGISAAIWALSFPR